MQAIEQIWAMMLCFPWEGLILSFGVIQMEFNPVSYCVILSGFETSYTVRQYAFWGAFEMFATLEELIKRCCFFCITEALWEWITWINMVIMNSKEKKHKQNYILLCCNATLLVLIKTSTCKISNATTARQQTTRLSPTSGVYVFISHSVFSTYPVDLICVFCSTHIELFKCIH